MPEIFNPRVVAGLRLFGLLASIAGVLLGGSVLLGWLTGSESLVTVAAGLAAMSPLTASGFVLAGLSIATRRLGRPRGADALVALVLVIFAAVLAGYAATGEDLLNPLLGNRFSGSFGPVVGNTAPATAWGFLLVGVCLLFLGREGRRSNLVLVCASAGGMLISGLALLGYAYGVQDLYALAFYRTTALHTAAGLFVLFLACFIYDPERGWAAIIASGLPSGAATRVQLVMSIAVPFLTGLLVLRVLDIAPSLAVGIVVASTIVPLVLRVLYDGRKLDDLEVRRRAAVEAQRRLTEELEERVRERTESLMLAESKLRQSQKMEAIGQLTGGLAHDFNNLLTGIGGSLDMIGTRLAQGRVQDVDRYVTAAKAASRRAAALTHRLLSFSRRQTLDPRPTDINRLVAGMDELLRRTVGPQIAVEVVAAGGLWATLIDASQLDNALLNLCINARDAMPDGGRLGIETANRWFDDGAAAEHELAPGQYVSLRVSDTGTGMTAEVAERAIDPFFTTKPIGVGTGLGLSMVYGFVHQSGGQMRIDTEPGAGTAVSLFLPRHLGEADSAEALPPTGSSHRAEPGRTVLVVDDEPAVRMLVVDVLDDLGYEALEAADGAAGLRILRSAARVDLLVSDVGLPGGLNGRQVADAAREIRSGLPVLFITGYAETALLNHGQLEPGMHVLTKPFAMEALASRIKELLSS